MARGVDVRRQQIVFFGRNGAHSAETQQSLEASVDAVDVLGASFTGSVNLPSSKRCI